MQLRSKYCGLLATAGITICDGHDGDVDISGSSIYSEVCLSCGGVLASTWVLTVEEHAGALEDLVKTSTLYSATNTNLLPNFG